MARFHRSGHSSKECARRPSKAIGQRPRTSGTSAVRPSDEADASGENPYYYKAVEIQQLYEAALGWLWVVIECYREASRPFNNGAFHPVPTGPIRWDAERGWWMTRLSSRGDR